MAKFHVKVFIWFFVNDICSEEITTNDNEPFIPPNLINLEPVIKGDLSAGHTTSEMPICTPAPPSSPSKVTTTSTSTTSASTTTTMTTNINYENLSNQGYEIVGYNDKNATVSKYTY